MKDGKGTDTEYVVFMFLPQQERQLLLLIAPWTGADESDGYLSSATDGADDAPQKNGFENYLDFDYLEE